MIPKYFMVSSYQVTWIEKKKKIQIDIILDKQICNIE